MKKKDVVPTRMVPIGDLGTGMVISYEKGSCDGCAASADRTKCLAASSGTREEYLPKADPNCLTAMIIKENPDISIGVISRMISAIMVISNETSKNNLNIKKIMREIKW